MSTKTITMTQKELDKIKGEERKTGYDMGVTYGKSMIFPFKTESAIKAVKLIDALIDFLDDRYDERYEYKKEDY